MILTCCRHTFSDRMLDQKNFIHEKLELTQTLKTYFTYRFRIFFHYFFFLQNVILKTSGTILTTTSARVCTKNFVMRLFTSELCQIMSLTFGNDRLLSNLCYQLRSKSYKKWPTTGDGSQPEFLPYLFLLNNSKLFMQKH